MIYIQVKYTMQHGKTVKKEKTPASQFGKWANETWTNTRKWLELSVRRLSWGQFFDIKFHSTLTLALYMLSKENLKHLVFWHESTHDAYI